MGSAAGASTVVFPEENGRKWKPGFLSQFPLIGFGALALSLCCTAAAIAIILLSDGRPTSEWSGNRQPGVLLAYTSTLANGLLGIAFAEAVVVAFWTQALRGVPMSNFHFNWAGGTSVIGAVMALGNGRALLISTVSILVAITTLLRGPLMQRASFVQTDVLSIPGNIDMQVTYNVSADWAGISPDRGHTFMVFSSGYAKVVREFQARSPIQVPGASCDNCSLTLPAFGFSIECREFQAGRYNLTTDGFPSIQPNATLFQSQVSRHFDESMTPVKQSLNITVMRRTDPVPCEGLLAAQTCLLTPARVTYQLSLNAGNVSFKADSWRNDSVGTLLDSTGNRAGISATVFALQVFGSHQYDSNSSTFFGGGAGWMPNTYGLLANTYANHDSKADGCAYSRDVYNDPMDDIINAYREIALRMSVAAAADGHVVSTDDRGITTSAPYSQNVPYTSELVRVQYAADRGNLAVAVIISLLGPVATLGLFWGWWKLGRTFSLSPLEVANAFSTGTVGGGHSAVDVVVGGGSNASARELAKHVRNSGDPVVRYGVGDANRLVVAFSGAESLKAPKANDVL
ncbi:hypothetical protein B0T16DRAFT_496649 [Cercophora newfieldiana]|uniref:Uncharacterized protein n=1 Tax=Cercophora newfieldiana TaxID=92897 RepID=A0AA40CM60_9PEZI|nr:hypothetical protein B0T16DRAFT_496649 [Cercophora newfieldiana]